MGTRHSSTIKSENRITTDNQTQSQDRGALIANNFDVKWIMSQVGHADSKMTLDVYAQLEQRVDRRHGTAFDALIREARTANRATIGPRGAEPTSRSNRTKRKRTKQRPAGAGRSHMARPGLEPGTPRFSVVCSTN